MDSSSIASSLHNRGCSCLKSRRPSGRGPSPPEANPALEPHNRGGHVPDPRLTPKPRARTWATCPKRQLCFGNNPPSILPQSRQGSPRMSARLRCIQNVSFAEMRGRLVSGVRDEGHARHRSTVQHNRLPDHEAGVVDEELFDVISTFRAVLTTRQVGPVTTSRSSLLRSTSSRHCSSDCIGSNSGGRKAYDLQ